MNIISNILCNSCGINCDLYFTDENNILCGECIAAIENEQSEAETCEKCGECKTCFNYCEDRCDECIEQGADILEDKIKGH